MNTEMMIMNILMSQRRHIMRELERPGTRLMACRECIYVVRANYKARNMSLPFVHRWAAGIPGDDGDQGRAWPDSAGSQREQSQ